MTMHLSCDTRSLHRAEYLQACEDEVAKGAETTGATVRHRDRGGGGCCVGGKSQLHGKPGAPQPEGGQPQRGAILVFEGLQVRLRL